jgi:hypothetical protein
MQLVSRLPPDGKKAYVSTQHGSSFEASDVVVINTADRTVNAVLSFSPIGHLCVGLSPDGTRA